MPAKPVPNRAWDITGDRDAVLRIGQQRLRLADIHGVTLAAGQERDFLASLLTCTMYLLVAGVFLILVLLGGWRDRFLLATSFFAVVGLTSVVDICLATPVKLYTLRITTGDAGVVDFTSADAMQVDALMLALQRAGKA
jgi:Family of unknown function (DUF6232)